MTRTMEEWAKSHARLGEPESAIKERLCDAIADIQEQAADLAEARRLLEDAKQELVSSLNHETPIAAKIEAYLYPHPDGKEGA